MRLRCDCEISNRLLPTFNMRNKGKVVRSVLSVGRKPGSDFKDGEVYLMICTKQDRNGAKYKLKNNIQQFFTKFIQEGKATIRFQEPSHDLCLSKADPVELKSFLSVVRLGYQGHGLEKTTLSSLAPASAKQVEKLKTRLSINAKKDYPLTTGFPCALLHLQVCHCNLRRFDSRMLQLRQLKVLDLGHNRIQQLPDSMDSLECLSELRVSDNQISEIPRKFCTGRLSKTLTSLDITQNKLRIIRPYFCELRALVTLKLDQNEIVCLPHAIGQLTRLRFLSAANNKLKTLPAGFIQLRLETLDIFGNDFLQDGPSSALNRLTFPSLLECAARSIKKHRVSYTEEDVGHLVEFLNSGKTCLCGAICFRSFVHYLTRFDMHHVAASITAIDQCGRMHAPCEAFLCSNTCYQKYQKNPNATIWKR